jgi:IS30 family transposase
VKYPRGTLTAEDYERIAERRERVAEMTRAGYIAEDIAATLGVTRRTVERDRVAAGVAQPYPPPMTEEQIRRVAELLDDGCSIAEAARTVGCSRRQVFRLFPGRGWTRQQIGQYRHWRAKAQKVLVDI